MKRKTINSVVEKKHIWQKELDEIKQRQLFADQLGGKENISKHHEKGYLTARERIHHFLDSNSFREVGAFTGKGEYSEDGSLLNVTPSNIVIGKGKVNKRRVFVVADDFTIRGGSSEAASPEKMVYAEKAALENRIPLIRFVNTAGGSIRLLEKNKSSKIPGYPQWPIAKMLDTIPVVAAAFGACAGLGALRVVHSHFSIMVREKSQIFAAGPYVVAPGIREEISKEDLGGYKVHAKSGVIDNIAEDEFDAFEQIKRFLSYLPSSAFKIPPRIDTNDPIERIEDELASIIPRDRRKVYDMKKVLEAVFDKDSLFEIGKDFGSSLITMLGRLNGYPVGILANNPYVYAGALSDTSSEKMIKFVDTCDTFNIPIVNFFDQPGVLVGKNAEEKGTIRKALNAMLAVNQVSIPWSTIFVRRAFGVAGCIWGPDDQRYTTRYAWPSAHWGSIPIEGGVEAAYRRELENSENPDELLEELIKYYRQYESPFRTAEQFRIENIIDPRETRQLLCEWIEEAYELLPEIIGIKKRGMRI